MMVRVLSNAYSKGIKSTQNIFAACEDDIAYRWLTGNMNLQFADFDPSIKNDSKQKANTTDPDSRIMKTQIGRVQGYDCQAVTDENQFIVATKVTQDCNEAHQLKPMLEKVHESLATVDHEQSAKTLSADVGYWFKGLDNQKIEDDGPELILATRKSWKQRKVNRVKAPPRGRIPKGDNASTPNAVKWLKLSSVKPNSGSTVVGSLKAD